MRGKKGGRRKKGHGHGSGSGSSSGSGHGSGISILMRGVRTERNNLTDGKVFYERNEFYRIDIKKINGSGKYRISSKKWFDSQLDCYGAGSKLVRVNGSSRIYNLAKSLIIRDVNNIPDNIQGIHCLKSVSWVDLNDNSDPKEWKSGPPLDYYTYPIQYACLGHNIYSLSSGYLPEPKVLDTTTNNEWVLCPPGDGLDLNEVVPNILPDATNKRILFQLTDVHMESPVIFSWHPELDPPLWKIISEDIELDTWMDHFPTLVDDVIFFHSPTFFSAYNLTHKQWMSITLSRSRFWPPHLICREIDHMFYLGDSRLCLVSTLYIIQDIDVFYEHHADHICGVNVFFDVFHFEPDKSDPLHINIAHSFTKSISFDDIARAADFLPLGAYFDG